MEDVVQHFQKQNRYDQLCKEVLKGYFFTLAETYSWQPCS